jgi:WD40 repeat protein
MGVHGMASYKRYNIHYLDEEHILFATGNNYQIMSLITKKRQIFHGDDTDGVGSVAVHPKKTHFAVAMKGSSPNILIFEYPSLKLYRILRKGTEMLFAHCEFSSSGHKLVSLGGYPDFTLTVWDWMAQKVILKSKASSQEVFKASFSPYTDDILFTGGSGHIKFWKMAQTFTGLKLQAEIGKFGQLELSDTSGYYELPDGKVLSGTEYGTLILWEGNLVKAHLVQDHTTMKPCHDGMIEFIVIEGDFVITAGGDGYIKWWKFMDVENAEADDIQEVDIRPIREVLIKDPETGKPAYIVSMIRGEDNWLIQDGHGNILKFFPEAEADVQNLWSFHSKSIADLKCMPNQNGCLTIGQDGVISLWDYLNDKRYYKRQFQGEGTCLTFMKHNDLNRGRVFAAGFGNGVVRICSLDTDNITIITTFKAHDTAVVRCLYNESLTYFITCSKDGDMFIFNI